jgi:hypothetical protein
MLREGAPAGPLTPTRTPPEPAAAAAAGAGVAGGMMASPSPSLPDAQQGRARLERLERELADARRQLSAAASSPAPRWRSVENVEAEGATTLAAEDAAVGLYTSCVNLTTRALKAPGFEHLEPYT